MRRIRRGGAYFRIADPEWADALDATYAKQRGGRWNPPPSFPVLYLNRDLKTARANVERKFAGLPYGPETLRPEDAPLLIETAVADADFVDVVTDEGCVAVELPATCPLHRNGREVGWARCQPIGLQAWGAAEAGIACRRAATRDRAGEELALFRRPGQAALGVVRRFLFEEWFW